MIKHIAKSFRDLPTILKKAGSPLTAEEYVRKTVFGSLYASIGFALIIFLFSRSLISLILIPVLIPIFFMFMSKSIYNKIKSLDANISKEIVFAGRFLIIELESGIPLYNTFENIGANYIYVGKYFEMIVEKVHLGTGIDEAINETIEVCPSENLNKMLWQVLNSIKTGSDISKALNSVLEKIMREQQISIKEFGNKLNPLAMFYMMIAIIVPSLGITMLIVVSSFISLQFSLTILLIVAVFIGFLQLMFLLMIRNLRPNVEL